MFTSKATSTASLNTGNQKTSSRAEKRGNDFEQLMNRKLKTKASPKKMSKPQKAKVSNNNEAPDTPSQQKLAQQPKKKKISNFKLSSGMRARMDQKQQAKAQARQEHIQRLQNGQPKTQQIQNQNTFSGQQKVGDLTINNLGKEQQMATVSGGMNNKLFELKSTLNQLKDVIDQQNNTIASLTKNQEASFLQEVQKNGSQNGFSINQSAEQKNSEVLFWPGSDIDGLELKAKPMTDTFVGQASYQKENPFMQNFVAKAQQGMQKSDLQIGSVQAKNNMVSKDLQKAFAEQLQQDVVTTESPLQGGLKGLAQQKSTGDEALGFENFFAPQDRVDAQVDGIDGQNFGETLEVATKEDGQQSKIENMNSIVKQVRTFIKDGGGEMQVELAPEGMGKVQLKVNVDSGKVNVEMMTDNDIAKKALEESLVDMKSSLENQKLIVDNLKVEMSKDYQKDFSQMENMMQEHANRDFAQQFMDNFNNERDERMTSLFDGFRNYINEPAGPDLALKAQRSYFGEGKGRSLNLKA